MHDEYLTQDVNKSFSYKKLGAHVHVLFELSFILYLPDSNIEK